MNLLELAQNLFCLLIRSAIGRDGGEDLFQIGFEHSHLVRHGGIDKIVAGVGIRENALFLIFTHTLPDVKGKIGISGAVKIVTNQASQKTKLVRFKDLPADLYRREGIDIDTSVIATSQDRIDFGVKNLNALEQKDIVGVRRNRFSLNALPGREIKARHLGGLSGKKRRGLFLQKLNIENLAIAAPDMGGAKRANAYARYLQCPVIICHKSRERANVVGSITAIGDVQGKNVVIVDDMIDTAGTLAKAANVLKEMGALSVRACATHPVFSGPAYDRIAESALEEVIVADTIPLSSDPAKDKSKITVLSMSDIFADIIDKVYNYEEISSSFIN